MPLDMELAIAPVETSDDDQLEWCFDDVELTQQLRAVKSGRGKPIAMVVGGTLVLFGAMFFGS